MLGFAASVADGILDALCQGILYFQLHTGEPGPDGMSNVAINSERKPVSFTPSSGGMNVSTVDLKWSNVDADETYTHFSVWDAPAGGQFVFSGTVSETQVSEGFNFIIPAGADLSVLKVAT